MENKIAVAIIPMKIKDLICMIMERKRLGLESAISYLYQTKFYTKLINDNTKLWYYGSEALYVMLEEETREKEVNTEIDYIRLDEREVLFCVFCIENYIRLKYPQEKDFVLSIFSTNKVYDYLIKNYDVLHTQSEEYIMDMIEEFIEVRKTEISC